jgi:hypothetical protein
MKKRFYLQGLVIGCLLLLSGVVKGASVPVISGNPANDTVCSGIVARFLVVASDTSASPATITYVWQLSTNGGGSWGAIPTGGAYTASADTLYVTSAMAQNGYLFRAIASNTSGHDTSLAGRLKVDTTSPGGITGPASVCSGHTITLSGPVAGGIWSASNDTATVSTLGVVTGMLTNGVLPGHDTIMYNFSNTCGAYADTFAISVLSSPAAGTISGPASLCKNGTAALTETVSGGIWSRSHPTVDSVSATGIVYGLNFGYDTVTYTTNNGSCTSNTTHAIRVDTTATAKPISGPSTTCVGNTISLTNANVLGTWVWSASNGHAMVSTSGMVTGMSGGLDTISYVFTNACNSVTSRTTVQVDTVLYPGIISGPSSVCSGSNIHLNESLAGGIWLSSNASLAVVDGSGNVTGVAQGVPLISYLVSNGCGASVATHAVTVNIPAGVITGLDSVGVDSVITVGNASIGGAWSIADTSIAQISSTGVVTGMAVGNTTATYTINNSCGISIATRTIYVGALPFVSEIDGADTVCIGASITLSDTITGGTWSGSQDTIATVSSSGVVTGVSKGQVIITYTFHNAFGTTIKVKAVFVQMPPVIIVSGPNVISLGGNYFLFGSPSGGAWTSSNDSVGMFVSSDYFPDTAIGTVHHIPVTYGSYVVTKAGTNTLTYTVRNICGIVSKTFVVTLAPSTVSTPGIEANTGSLMVFPNPNNGEFTVNFSSASTEAVAITVTNIIGEKVKELNISTNKKFDIKLDQPAGLYLISAITSGGNIYKAKITVAR